VFERAKIVHAIDHAATLIGSGIPINGKLKHTQGLFFCKIGYTKHDAHWFKGWTDFRLVAIFLFSPPAPSTVHSSAKRGYIETKILHITEVLGSNLNVTRLMFSLLYQIVPGKSRVVSQVRPRPLPSASLPIYCHVFVE
jgi:hypothetical protein